jgi:dihydropteroate synthase
MIRPRLLFVTGKLAEPALRRILAELAPRANFDYGISVLPITVVALATTPWIGKHLAIPTDVQRVILPGLCQGDMTSLNAPDGITVERGPTDVRDLPDFFQADSSPAPDLTAFDIEILAEINHGPRIGREDLVAMARHYRSEGADVIDLGCDPGSTWPGVGDAVRNLRDEGFRVSIDSFDPIEVREAVKAGAELVLSVNASNVDAAGDWGCEVVALPDDLATLGGLDRTVEALVARGIRFRIDPVIEPIGLGFAASVGRYLEVRRRYPDAELMMGVGNLTELTDVDSSGINVLLLGFCQEIGVRSVLTTQVINWARSSVRELDLARRLVHYSITRQVLPKHVLSDLVVLRDPKLLVHGEAEFNELGQHILDRNFRLFAEGGRLHAINGSMHLTDTDPFDLFAAMSERENIDPSHAFYLGYEMAKAVTALTLGKNYVQDRELRWGFLTVPEGSHRGKMPGAVDGSSDEPRKPTDNAP